MAELNNQDYHARRAQHSRELALNAANCGIARIHLEMATRYEKTGGRDERGGKRRRMLTP